MASRVSDDPRIVHTRRVVREAALSELAAVGFSGFTIESVASRAGVGKSTIYRHWDGHLDLIADTLEDLNRQPLPAPHGGTSIERIQNLVRHFAEAMADPNLSGAVPALADAAERHPEVAAFFHDYNRRRLQTLVEEIRSGIEDGELDSQLDPELAAITLVGPFLYRRVMTDHALPPDEADLLVACVLDPRSDG